MHEMALCHGMMQLIEDQRVSQGFARVKRVIVELGALGHVDPHALRFAFDVVTADTIAESATLELQELPAKGWCMDCSQQIELQVREGGCPLCGGHTLILQEGEQMRLKELEVA